MCVTSSCIYAGTSQGPPIYKIDELKFFIIAIILRADAVCLQEVVQVELVQQPLTTLAQSESHDFKMPL